MKKIGEWSWRAAAMAVALLFACGAVSSAQRYTFQEYSHGLDNLNVTSIAQDQTGYLWVGTQNGAFRYDGSQFKRFGKDAGLPERTIVSMYSGLDGTLWVGTTEGIYFQKSNGNFEAVRVVGYQGAIALRGGTVFASHDADHVIAATRTGGLKLTRISKDVWAAVPFGLEGKTIWGVLYDSRGNLWYGCDNDLCEMSQGKTSHVAIALGAPEENWQSLLVYSNGHIWARGTHTVMEISPETNSLAVHDLPGTGFAEPYPQMVADAQGRILVSEGARLAIWQNGNWRVLSERNGMSPYEIQALFIDREGSVWLGVVGHGLRRWLAQGKWESYTTANGLNDNLVWGEVRDHQGRLWIATEQGLDWIPAGGLDPVEWLQPGIEMTRVGAVAVGQDGAIWASSSGGSIVRIDPKTLAGRHWAVPEIFRLMADPAGNIWAATREGLYKVEPKNWDLGPKLVESDTFGRVNQRFNDLALDTKGNVWAAGDQGIFALESNEWHQYQLGGTESVPDVITFDKNGNLWTAGPARDLAEMRVDKQRLVEVHRVSRPEILSQQIVALMTDHRGWVWVGQDAGLSVFDGTNWHSFTLDDGLVWNDIDSYALHEDTDGSIWAGTSGGLSHLMEPSSLSARHIVPPVFSQVSYGGSALSNGGTVQWSDAPLDISMAILSFGSGHGEAVRYRMKGPVNTAWDEARDFAVRYGQLGPGKYQFEAVTVDGAGRVLSNPVTFSFKITPRWWQLSSLHIAAGIIVIVLILVYWRWRVGYYLARQRHLERAVRQRTEELESEKTELVRMKDQMRHYAEHDGLSGLWNHRMIMERLHGEVERSRRDDTPLSIILADVDHFKKINDTFGHPVGDRVLKEVSALFQKMVRTYDWVGRYGGEEFLLVLPGTNMEIARARAEELRDAVEALCVKEGVEQINITISLGVAAGFPSNYESMVQAADAALYRAKNTGRNRVVATDVSTARRKHMATAV